ncbi:MAG: hypothetical protein JSR41_14040 [Proteobacteria bacterium]|nr:hypothetical protein [Pseudomonadota bacterium]
MSAFQLLNHLFNFVLPALAVALMLALGARLLMKKGAGAPGLWVQVAINFVAGVVVLLAGLVVTGRDGRIATYAALVVVCGTVQWGVLRGWKR